MRKNIFKTVAVALGLCLIAGPALAQGIVVHKKDGSKIYYKAEEVDHVGVYGFGEEPQPQPLETKIYTVNGVQFKMVLVEGGTFLMGATSEQQYPNDEEKPVHQVTLSSFCVGETEVTQELWEAVMGANPSNWKGSKLPVEQVSWYDCQTFIMKLNELTGVSFRLPTEAEWEYAARGGNQSKGYMYSGSNTINEVAWHSDNSDSKTHQVATKKSNELGLYDMSGNVWEWCQDWFGSYSSSEQTNPTGSSTGSERVYRGGSWRCHRSFSRVSFRNCYMPSFTVCELGLRLAQ